jgi:hypothetical protein
VGEELGMRSLSDNYLSKLRGFEAFAPTRFGKKAGKQSMSKTKVEKPVHSTTVPKTSTALSGYVDVRSGIVELTYIAYLFCTKAL